jgi:hypothetical protein
MTKRTPYLASIAFLAMAAGFAQNAQANFVAIFEETVKFGLPAVQEIGDGTIDLTDLGAGTSISVSSSGMTPSTGFIVLGFANRTKMTFFNDAVITGPSSFGVGSATIADRINGNPVAAGPLAGPLAIGVPEGYVSEAALRNTTQWIDATYSSLGVTPGVYTWSWGSGADADSFTIDIVAPTLAADGKPLANNSILSTLPLPTTEEFPLTFAVPEPSTWAMMLIGFVGLGYAAVRRTRSVASMSA